MSWLIEHIDDVRSDLSRFHRIDDVESMRADRCMAYTVRLPAYDGVLALRLRQEHTTEEPPVRDVQAHAFNPTPEDLARMYPAAPGAGQMVPMFEHTVV